MVKKAENVPPLSQHWQVPRGQNGGLGAEPPAEKNKIQRLLKTMMSRRAVCEKMRGGESVKYCVT